MNNIVFKPSNAHQGHYVYINGESTGIVVNLFAYETIEEYRNKIDAKIEKVEFDDNNKTKKDERKR